MMAELGKWWKYGHGYLKSKGYSSCRHHSKLQSSEQAADLSGFVSATGFAMQRRQ